MIVLHISLIYGGLQLDANDRPSLLIYENPQFDGKYGF